MTEPSTATLAVHSVAEITAPHASRYLQQLCKHFAHKRPVIFNEQTGRIEFSIGECRLEASDGRLQLSLAAPDDAQMSQLQEVVARHLLRFAFREEMQIDWQPA
jgi:uncharacterized protein